VIYAEAKANSQIARARAYLNNFKPFAGQCQ